MMFGHGDDLYVIGEKQVRYNFSSNVWFGAPHSALRRLLNDRFEEIMHYPEPDAGILKTLLAEHHGLSRENVLVTNGSIAAFYLIAQTWPSSKSAILEPTFAEYEDACRLYDHRLLFLDNRKDLLQMNWEDCDFCWICNPNNPDGHFIETEKLLSCIVAHPRVNFILDQVYAEFTLKDSVDPSLIRNHPNLIVIRSISKSCNIPGMRMGYVLADEEKIRKMNHFLIPWSVNSPVLEICRYVLGHSRDFVLPVAEWLEEKNWLQAELSKIEGVEVMASATPFFLTRLTEGSASVLKTFLLEHFSILIRDASNFRGLDQHYFRLSTQSRDANRLLLEGIARFQNRRPAF